MLKVGKAKKQGLCKVCGRPIAKGSVVYRTYSNNRVRYMCVSCFLKMKRQKVVVAPLRMQAKKESGVVECTSPKNGVQKLLRKVECEVV